MKILLAILFSLSLAHAYDFGDLKKSDQMHFQNEYGEGKNQLERIDLNVKEINKMWSEINTLKAEVKKLKQEINQATQGQRK